MKFYYTDNTVSLRVMRSFERAGVESRHIKDFNINTDTPIFYGILRGCGSAMKALQYLGLDYLYVDNGYFDAVYMDEKKKKDMHGEYRVVRNRLIEPYTGEPVTEFDRAPMNVLLLPPSPYAANMHDTTPEDWTNEWIIKARANGDYVEARKKDHKNPVSFTEEVQNFDAVVTMNSMSVIEATKLGKAVYDTHGVFRNAGQFDTKIPYYEYKSLEDFYSTKQFTLDEIEEGQWN